MIRKRKISRPEREQPTSLLSLNQFTVSYLAYLSFFIYGYSIESFNHYIVWHRLIASVLVAIILFEIWQGRKFQPPKGSFCSACVTLLFSISGLFIGETITDHGRHISTTIIILVSILIAQGYYHQI